MREPAFVGKGIDLDYLAKEAKIAQFLTAKRPHLIPGSRRGDLAFPKLIVKVKGILIRD